MQVRAWRLHTPGCHRQASFYGYPESLPANVSVGAGRWANGVCNSRMAGHDQQERIVQRFPYGVACNCFAACKCMVTLSRVRLMWSRTGPAEARLNRRPSIKASSSVWLLTMAST